MNDDATHESPLGEGRTSESESPAELAYYSKSQRERARTLLSRLYAARRATRLYPTGHAASLEALQALAECVGEYHKEDADVELVFHQGEILLGRQLLAEESVLFDQLVRDLTSLGVGSLVVKRGASIDELSRLLEVLCADRARITAAGGAAAMAGAMELPHVEIHALSGVSQANALAEGPDEEPRAGYGRAVSLLREMERLLRLNRTIPAAKIDGAVRSLVDNVLANRYPMLQLAGLKNYDEYTFYHSANVAILSLAVGAMISTDYRFLSSLGVSALLHDIGKLSIDTALLNKQGPPTMEEWVDLCRHPVTGAHMVSQLPGVDRTAIVAVLEHHMRYDGSGYPQRTPRRPQHLASRIVAVADSYDAMTSHRSYSPARRQDEAMGVLADSGGTHYDPAVVRLFIRALGVYPPRSVVRLSSGEIAVVVQPSPKEPARPVVRVIADERGRLAEPRDIDLSVDRSTNVHGCVDPSQVDVDLDDYL